jgi:hypothetical protein
MALIVLQEVVLTSLDIWMDQARADLDRMGALTTPFRSGVPG